MSKILIIGGTGYLGSFLVKSLAKNHCVYFTGRRELDSPNYYQLDLNDPSSYGILDALKVDLVVITACNLSGLSHRSIDSSFQENTFYYGRFLEYITKQKLSSKFIYISSMTVYNDQNSVPVEETHSTINQPNIYGFSKHIAEQITQFVCLKHGCQGISLRLPGLFGGDRKNGLIYNCINKAISNDNITIDTNGLEYWECMYLPTVVKSIDFFIQNYKCNSNYDTFNLGYGKKQDIGSVVFLIKDILSSKSKVQLLDIPKPFHLDVKKISKIISLETSLRDDMSNYISILADKNITS